MNGNLFGIGFIILIIAALLTDCLVGCPSYRVYQQTMEGRAELQRAISKGRLPIQEAHPRKQSAQYLADAEIIRAKGIAKSNYRQFP